MKFWNAPDSLRFRRVASWESGDMSPHSKSHRRCRCWHFDRKGRAFAQTFAVCANGAAVHLEDRFADRQTKTEAFPPRTGLLESIEDFLGKLRRDPNSGVANFDRDRFRRRVEAAHRDSAELGSELAGVAQHVPKNLLQARWIDNHGVRRRLEGNGNFTMSIFEIAAHDLDGIAE